MRVSFVPLTLVLGGCCCGLGGGGGGGGFSDAMSEKITEEAAEKIIEASSGGQVEVEMAGAGFSVDTPDGKMTTWADGSMPKGFPCNLPGNMKVVSASQIEPKDGTPTTWSITYTTTDSWETAATYWMTEGVRCGYKATSGRAELEAALAEAKAAGVDITATGMAGTGLEKGDMIGFETDDPNKNGGVVIDGSSGTTTVTVSMRK